MFSFRNNNYNYRNLIIKIKIFLNKIYQSSKVYFNDFHAYVNRFVHCPKMNLLAFIGIIISIGLFYQTLIVAPADFPKGTIITVEKGEILSEIAFNLEEEKVIKSAEMFEFFTNLLMSGDRVMAGDYFFEKDYSVIRIVWRTIRGVYGIAPTRIVIVEGSTIFNIAETLKTHFEDFDKDKFVKLAEAEEGYLFPDTYYFLPNVTPKAVIKTMKENFEKRLEEISLEIEESGNTLEEIVIMASILEKEARTLKSKQKIAGILWKRIDINMPLQVDAVFPYIIGKNTYQLTLDDLKTESPYNTYTNKGLPIGPIANPSIYSLLAAATPVESNYLFYLSDRSGNMYYAENFEIHKENKRLYMN
ncbi:MAG: endolytic transglycosylase MltG [Candidatus Pacebacteria bacterium]|nr:endolytic transglycosylase MltG [Candidatus Paceibacterota bacterium]